MLAALGGAAVARLGTNVADGGRQPRAPAHITETDTAQLGTVAASPHATGHPGVVDADVAAVLAIHGAPETRIKAVPKFVVIHDRLSRNHLQKVFRIELEVAGHPRAQPSIGVDRAIDIPFVEDGRSAMIDRAKLFSRVSLSADFIRVK